MLINQEKFMYAPPKIISIIIAPDVTKCMQNTGGTEPRSTFEVYKQDQDVAEGQDFEPPMDNTNEKAKKSLTLA